MDSGAYYSWREESFAIDILLQGGVDPECMELGDSIVTLPNGAKYSALMITREEIARIMNRHQVTGESLDGSYFCAPDLIVIRNKGVSAMVDVVRDIVHSQETECIAALLPCIGEDGVLEKPIM